MLNNLKTDLKYYGCFLDKDGNAISGISNNNTVSKGNYQYSSSIIVPIGAKTLVLNMYKDEKSDYTTINADSIMEPLITENDITNIKLIPDLKKSVSDGKVLLAGAITNKGVNTASTDTFETMANNINNINSGGSASKEYKYSTASDGPAITCNPCEDILIEVSCEYASKSE